MAEIKLRAMREEHAAAGSIPPEVFQDFRKRLIGLTDVTHSFFDKLVKQLEKGFAGIEKDFAGELPPALQPARGADGAGPSGSGGDAAGGSGGGGARKRRGGGAARGAAGDEWVCTHW